MNPSDPRNFGPQAPHAPPQPYPPQYPNYPPMGYPMAQSPMAQRSDNEATTIFVLGLLGLVACQLLAPFAWVKGNSYRATCRAMEVEPNSLATVGWILGIIGTVVMGLSLVVFVLAFALTSVR